MSEFDFENEILIDLDSLHKEWQTHANIRYKYAGEVSRLDQELKKKNEELNLVKAKFVKECKEQNAKATVQQIEGFCMENEEHASLTDKRIAIEYELNMAKNALKAFDDRKVALENEVKLCVSDYFSSPTEERVIEPSQSIVAKGRDEATSHVRESMNKKRRETI